MKGLSKGRYDETFSGEDEWMGAQLYRFCYLVEFRR